MSLTGEFDSINDSDNVRVIQENGSTIDFIKATDGTFVASQGTQAKLEKVNNNYVLTRKTGYWLEQPRKRTAIWMHNNRHCYSKT